MAFAKSEKPETNKMPSELALLGILMVSPVKPPNCKPTVVLFETVICCVPAVPIAVMFPSSMEIMPMGNNTRKGMRCVAIKTIT